MDKEKLIEEEITSILNLIGENSNREGLVDTPKRVAKMYMELFKGYDKTKFPTITTFHNGCDGVVTDEMINDEGEFYSHCEHHMVPFFGRYYFAYVPSPKGKVLGLSKVARVVDYFSSKLQIQERLGQEIIDCLWNELCKDTKYPPLGMGLVIIGEHLCKSMRGVKKKGKMRTAALKGCIKHEPMSRTEFLNWVNVNGKE